MVTVVTTKLSKHTAYRPRRLIVIQAAHIGFRIRMRKNTILNQASLLVMRLFLRTVGWHISVCILYEQHELQKTGHKFCPAPPGCGS